MQLSSNYFVHTQNGRREKAHDINPAETITCAEDTIKFARIIFELRSIDKTTLNYHKLSYNTHNFHFTSSC